MYKFWQKNKIFFGIIIGALIIGGFIYLGLLENKKAGTFTKAGNQTVSLKASDSDVNVNAVENLKLVENKTPPVSRCGAEENTIVTKVIDGDTVVVEGGYHVRLLGMDADEKGYPCYDQAKTRLEALVLGKTVKLEKDKTDVDQYGRCLRYIFIDNKNVDTQLTAEGLAVARFYEPDVKYRAEITKAEQQAQQNKLGCKWSGDSQVAK